jgi:hypothetical protein
MARTIRLAALAAVALAAAFGCQEQTEPISGSETHFLTACSESCAQGAECVCGACTRTCDDDAACRAFAVSAACVALAPRIAEGRCDADAPPAMCDVPCLHESDCASLGRGYRCESGYCRAGDTAPDPEPAACDVAALPGSELAVIGDALIQLSKFTADLEAEATQANMLAVGEHYRSYASSLYSILAGGSLGIENQYDTARAEGVPRVVVMNGGETDVLNVPCGPAPKADCPAITAAAAGAEALFSRMAADGVDHVVYFYYADPVGNADVKAGLDVLRPFVENACGRAPLPCHFLDLRPIFTGHPEYAAADGLVFGDAGASAAASAVAGVMLERCVTAAP